MMEIAHKYAEEQRQRLRDLGIDEKYFLSGKDLRHHFKSSEVQAVSYDPRSPVPIKMPDNDQYKFLLRMLLNGGDDAKWAQEEIELYNYDYNIWTGDPAKFLYNAKRDFDDKMRDEAVRDAILLLEQKFPNLTSEERKALELAVRKGAFEIARVLMLPTKEVSADKKVYHLIDEAISSLRNNDDELSEALYDKLLSNHEFNALVQKKRSILDVPLPDGPPLGVVGTIVVTPVKVVVETIEGFASTLYTIYFEPEVIAEAMIALKDNAIAEFQRAYADPRGYYNEKKAELKMSFEEFVNMSPEEKVELITRVVTEAAIARISYGITKGFKAADGVLDAVKDDKDFDKGTPVTTPEMDKPSEGTGKASESYLSPEMEQKILGGERIPGKNGVRGGHSPNVVNDANPNYAVEVLRENPDGTKFVQFYHQFPDGTLAKLKKSTVFPDSWSDEKIISSIKKN